MHSTRLIGALAFAASAQAHVIMNTPTPYGFKTLQTSPLYTAGDYTFPCQGGGDRADDVFNADGAYNPMTVGQSNVLNFTGSAVHGGGSCQLSVTYEYPPPADKSKWKVIHSYIGSCPAEAAGNLDTGLTTTDGRPDGQHCSMPGASQNDCMKTFDFKLPDGIKNGNATLAWTWLNKIGNREFYMNCAPITISGGSDDDTVLDSLPELFVANILGECTTEEGVFGYPNPGKYVTYGDAITPGAQGKCPAAASAGSSASSGSSSGSSTAASSPVASSSAAGTSLTYSAVRAGATSAAAADSDTTTVQATTMLSVYATSSAVASAYPLASGTASAAASGSTSSSGSCASGSVSCPTPGSIICIGTTQFGLCNIDNCAVPEALAAGTSCSGGTISKRDHVRRARSGRHGSIHKHGF